jgi:hypothetical protein
VRANKHPSRKNHEPETGQCREYNWPKLFGGDIPQTRNSGAIANSGWMSTQLARVSAGKKSGVRFIVLLGGVKSIVGGH